MPIDIRITAAGKDTTVTVWNSTQSESYSIPFSLQPTDLRLDPEGWILRQVTSEKDRPPSEFSLLQNFPNPFNSSTKILYRLSYQEHITVKIFDLLGREVETLVNEKQPAGVYEIPWNAANKASGIYFYRLTSATNQLQKKMLLLK
jgi:hypothetical protein